jgi:trk system potassium uptake protein TrkA
LQVELRTRYKLNLITLRRSYEVSNDQGERRDEYHILGVPSADTILYSSDFMVLLGKREDIERFVEVNR